MQSRTLASQGLVSFLALLLTTCGGNVPTSPTRETRDRALSNGDGASKLSAHADWLIEILRAPASGQTFKVNKQGTRPQPAPKFRFNATAPVDIPEGTVTISFLTAGGKECGLATIRDPIPFTANAPTTVDIPNDSILLGPDACTAGQNCTPNQCKFPLTTTKMRFLFGHKDQDQDVGQATESLRYKWTRSTPGGGASAHLTCGGTPVPDTVSCGVPTARCGDGTYSCSASPLTCWQRSHVYCYVCPGPNCP